MQRRYIEDPQTLAGAASNLNRAWRKLGVAIYFELPRPLRALIRNPVRAIRGPR